MSPTIGRIVHYYVGNEAEPLPAIITRVWSNECVNLHVFSDHGDDTLETSVPQRVTSTSWGWDWPPRV